MNFGFRSSLPRQLLWLSFFAASLFGHTADAVILSDGNGSFQTDSSGIGAAWNYVGSINGASGIYLGQYNGNSWVMTANHVGVGSFTLTGTSYPLLGSGFRLTNADNSPSDLLLYQISGNPGLPALNIASSSPGVNTQIDLVGNGLDRSNSLSTWTVDSTTNPWTWTSSPSGNESGYTWAGTATKRWGTNIVAQTGLTALSGTSAFLTNFGTLGAGPNAGSDNAQATVGDSGGGVFLSDGTLIGLIDAEGTFSGQPANTSVFGDGTFVANLSQYRPEILSIVAVPEMPTSVLLLAGLALVGTRLHPGRRKTADTTCRCHLRPSRRPIFRTHSPKTGSMSASRLDQIGSAGKLISIYFPSGNVRIAACLAQCDPGWHHACLIESRRPNKSRQF
jgi:hypothetical protein